MGMTLIIQPILLQIINKKTRFPLIETGVINVRYAGYPACYFLDHLGSLTDTPPPTKKLGDLSEMPKPNAAST